MARETTEEIQRDTVRMLSTLHDRVADSFTALHDRIAEDRRQSREEHRQLLAEMREGRAEIKASIEKINGQAQS